MAGEMTPEQWDMISKTLDKISILCETTIPKLDKKIDLVSSSIRGNGHKGLKTFVEEHEKKIEEIKNNKPKTVYSWKQTAATLSLVLLVAVFMTGFLTVRIEDQAKKNDMQYSLQSEKITKLSDMFYQHVIPNP